MMKSLIAVDGSEHVQHAIEAVGKMARAGLHVEVILLNVRSAPVFYGEVPVVGIEEIEAAQQKAQDELLAEARARAAAQGLSVRLVQRAVGLPGPEIVRVAVEEGADQIVMGTHGRGAMGSLFLGSVAQQVVHLAKMPVLLVK